MTIKYFAAPENQDLGVVKYLRKPVSKLDLSPFPAPLDKCAISLTCHGCEVDVPAIEAVQCVRPTQSLKFVAANRTSIAAHPGKEHAILIDHTENWKHHGLLMKTEHGVGPVIKDNALQSAVS